MKKLNTLFAESHKCTIDKIECASMNSKSEIARAAMTIGLRELGIKYVELESSEFYLVVIQNQGDK